jgi:hypothetical protein
MLDPQRRDDGDRDRTLTRFSGLTRKSKMGKSSKLGPGPTGPRTPKGKARSSRNAVKHGLFSERVSPAEENEAARLHRALRKDLHLQGFEDEFFGTDLVLTALKKTRLDKYVSNEYRKANMQALQDGVEKFELRWSLKKDSPSSANRVHPDICIPLLRKIETNIKRRGLNPQEDLPILYSLFSRGDGKLTLHGLSIILLYEPMKRAGTKTDGQSTDPRGGELQRRILERIGEAIAVEQDSARTEAMNDQEDLRLVNALLPDAVADRILRSETAIEGHFLRQLDALERYRRLRKRGSKR